jgi:hypothetical protein
MRLDTLPPGTRFQVVECPEFRGCLVRVTDGAALVRREAHAATEYGELRQFPAETVTISRATYVTTL